MTHRILVVEDNRDVQEFCTIVLTDAGFKIDCAATAAEARRLYDAARADLVIIDIGLPDGSGLDLLREWQARPGRKPPMLFLSGREDLNLRLECFQAGAQDYVLKPCAAKELLARVNVHLKIKQSQDDLLKRNDELELIARARQDMADMIVHDLKAPLASIKGTMQLVLSRGLISKDNYSSLLEQAGTAADFMLLMLNDLLDVAQAQQTGLKTEIKSVEVPVLLEKLRTLFSGRCRISSVELAAAYEPGCQRIDSDQNLLYRILANLISNAIKATPGGGKIEIDCRKDADKIRFAVADRGNGVPDAEKKLIFEKYVTTGRAGGGLETGTGLGLAFCRFAAEALRGRVWVEDRPGGGSLFLLELPQPAVCANPKAA